MDNTIKYDEGGQIQRHKSWNELSLSEKSEMIKVAVMNGITDLPTIKEKYNEFANGGGIHIAPSKKGTFTAAATKHGMGVQEFASKVLSHPENYSPAMRKKANFARNAAKWHGLGGNLFDGESQSSQQMEIGKKLMEERIREASVESNDNAWVETPLTYKKKNPHLSRRAEEGAKAHAAWEKEHPNLTVWGNVAGAVPFAVAAIPLGAGIVAGGDALAATSAGQTITSGLAPLVSAASTNVYGVPFYTWADAGLTSLFGGHGVQTAIDEGGVSPMAALEIAPLGRLAKPMWNAAANTGTALYNDMYIPYKISKAIDKGVKENAVITAYNRNPATKDVGNLWDYQYYLDKVFPNSKVKDVLWHGSISKNLQSFSPEYIGSNTPIKKSVGMYLAPERTTAANYGKKGGVYPVLLNTENPFITNQIFGGISKNGVNVARISPEVRSTLLANNDAVIAPKRGELAFFNPDDALILGSDADVTGFRRFMSNPQITAENAASMTPEQWTAAQDAAIARGNMDEAQRLRDLHFMIKAPNTVTSINGKPLQLYHGTNNDFNAFDLSKYGSTDGGTFGRGVYTTPIQEYAQLYGKNNMSLYMKLDNPRDYRDYSIGDLMAEKLAFGEDFSTGNGIDGVIGRPSWKGFKGLEEYVSHNPKNIKSSKAVTYDDKGVRIPLGLRDNFKINDIRYGLLPFLGLGAAGTLYGKQE